jgi:hypothetical protein
MFVPFESLPAHARTWIYQSDKKITDREKDIISQALHTFTQQWSVHGVPMETSFDIRFDRFVILAANDQASGCSIDSSVRAIKEVGESTGINFFNRDLVTFRTGDDLTEVSLGELKRKREEGVWHGETLVFNNLVNTKGDLEQHWIVPAKSTWLKRYLPQEQVTQAG